MTDPTSIRRLYGRRQGHKLRQGQAALVEDLLPVVSIPDEGPLDAQTLFGDPRPLEFEIGFGGGEHMAHGGERECVRHKEDARARDECVHERRERVHRDD